MPSAVQTQIVVGHLGVKRAVPDYAALNLGNQILGGSFNSRINMKLRANEGLTYGASSSFEPNRQAGMFPSHHLHSHRENRRRHPLSCSTSSRKSRPTPPTEAEFDEAKAYILGSSPSPSKHPPAPSPAALSPTTSTASATTTGSTTRKLIEGLTREQIAKAFSRTSCRPTSSPSSPSATPRSSPRHLEVFGPVRIIPVDVLDLAAPDMLRKKETVNMTAAGAAKAKSLLEAGRHRNGRQSQTRRRQGPIHHRQDQAHPPAGQLRRRLHRESFLYPDHYKLVLKLPVAEITQVLDGDKAWMGQGNMVQELPAQLLGAMKQSMLTGGTAIGLINAALNGKAQTSALEPVDSNGRKLNPVLIKLDELEVKLFLDPATNLPARITYRSMGMQGPADFEVELSDYKDAGGFMLPNTEVVMQNGQKAVEKTVTTRTVNSGVDPAIFKRPGA